MHKHFLIALLVGAGTLLAASCSEESTTVRQRTLEVVSSDTNFPVDGGSRTVTTARAAATAYAQDKWAQVQVENGQVIVKTDVNTDEQSRNTLLVVKDARGDSAAINVRQDGMIFRLPTSATVESDDQPLQRSFHVQFNVPVNITSSAPWIQVNHTPEGDVTFKVTANTSGRPRVGWLLSHAHGLTDSVRITQATLSDIVGTYRQHASTLDSSRTRMIDTTNVVTISKISDTKAMFSIDGNLNWECDFKAGQGLFMNNGKVLREVKNPPQPSTYLVSLLAANDFRPGHLNSIIGTRETLRVAIGDNGDLVFRQHETISLEQQWNSYAVGRASSTKLSLETYLGLFTAFINPTLTYLPPRRRHSPRHCTQLPPLIEHRLLIYNRQSPPCPSRQAGIIFWSGAQRVPTSELRIRRWHRASRTPRGGSRKVPRRGKSASVPLPPPRDCRWHARCSLGTTC